MLGSLINNKSLFYKTVSFVVKIFKVTSATPMEQITSGLKM